MSKGAKISLTIVICVLVILAIVGVVLAITPNTNKPQGELQKERLKTPTNLTIDDNWILSFDEVADASCYQIYIDGNANPSITTKQTSVDVSQYATRGRHSFQVKAKYLEDTTTSFDSLPSDIVDKIKTDKLATPTNLTRTESLLSWGSVNETVSYSLLITYGNNEQKTSYSLYNSFDLTEFLNENQEISAFSIKVKATSYNIITEKSDAYLLDSEYSNEIYYYRVNTIDAPTLRAEFLQYPEIIMKNEAQNLYVAWNTNQFVSEYVLIVDNYEIKRIPNATFDGQDTIRENLADYIDSISIDPTDTREHQVYVHAIPFSNQGTSVSAKNSNVIKYIIKDKLATPDASQIILEKQGTNLVVSWQAVENATGYNIILWGTTSTDDSNAEYNKVSLNGSTETYISNSTRFTQDLTNIVSSYKQLKVQVQACRKDYDYILDSDYSELSQSFSAITKLATPTNVTLKDNNGFFDLTWTTVNQSAVNGYMIEIYTAIVDSSGNYTPNAFVTSATTKATDLPYLNVTGTMTTASLEPGDYCLRIKTRATPTNNYFEDSDYSDWIGYRYKTQLATPVIDTISSGKNTSTGQIELYWTYVEGAQSYSLIIDGNKISEIPQPVAKPIDNLVSDNGYLNDYISNNNQPKVYTVVIQALANAQDNDHIDSKKSTSWSYTDRHQHSPVDANSIQFTTNENNRVSITWDEVLTAGGIEPYTIKVSNALYPNFTWTRGVSSNSITGLDCFVPGENYVSITVNGFNLFSDSTATVVNFTFNYDLTIYSDTFIPLSFEFVEGTTDAGHRVEISFDNIDKFVKNYYVEFTDKLGNITTQSLTLNTTDYSNYQKTCTISATLDNVPLYEITKIQIWAGKDENKVNQNNITPVMLFINKKPTDTLDKNTYAFENDLYMHSALLTISQDYILTLTLNPQSLNYVEAISWALTGGVDGIRMTPPLITEINETLNIDLKPYLKNGEDFILGVYKIESIVYSTNPNIESNASSVTFTIKEKLEIDTTSFVQSSANDYLQFDAVDKATGYIATVKFNGTDVTDFTPTFDLVNGTVRINTTPLFTKERGAGEYTFTITAIGNEEYYLLNSDPVSYIWQFSTQLDAPVIDRIIKDENNYYAVIKYHPLVDSYTATVVNGGSAGDLTNSITAIFNKYQENDEVLVPVVFEKGAGEYTINVTATPKNTDLYDSVSKQATISYLLQLPFDKVTNFKITQTIQEDSIVLSATWDDSISMTPFEISGPISPDFIQIEFRDKTGQDLGITTQLSYADYLNANIDAEIISKLTSMTYLVVVKAVAKEVSVNGQDVILYTDSAQSTTIFTFQQRSETPSLTLNNSTQSVDSSTIYYQTIVNKTGSTPATITLLQENQTNNQFDVRVQQISLVSPYEAIEGNILELSNQKLTAFTEGGVTTYTYNLTGGTHFTNRGLYSVQVRGSKNGGNSASLWSNAVYIYYATQLEELENVALSLDSANQKYTLTFDAPQILDSDPIKQDTLSGGLFNYTAVFSFDDSTTSFTKTSDQTTIEVTADDYPELFNAIQTAGTVVKVAITTQNSISNSTWTVPFTSHTLEGFNFAPASITNASTTIGEVDKPYNLNLNYENSTLNISWKGLTGSTYQYTLSRQNINGAIEYYNGSEWIATQTQNTTDQITLSIAFSGDELLSPYLFTFNILQSLNSTNSQEVTIQYSNTFDIASIQNFDIDYDKTNAKYLATWTHAQNAGTQISSINYTGTIGGITIFTGLAGLQAELDADLIAELVAYNRVYAYTIKTEDIKWIGTDFIAYKGKTFSGDIALPVVINSSPTNVSIDANGLISWYPVQNATQYKIWIKNNETGSIKATKIIDKTEIYIDDLYLERERAGYTIYIQVAEDTESKIYVLEENLNTIAEIFYEQTETRNAVSNISVTTTAVKATDTTPSTFQSVITWDYVWDEGADDSRTDLFQVVLKNSTSSYQITSDSLRPTFDSLTATGANRYILNLDGTDANDPTRTIPAGDYTLAITVLKDGLYNQSHTMTADYTNKIALHALTTEQIQTAFTIAPDCFVDESAILADGTYEAGRSQNLIDYESHFGFNKKYLIITNDTYTKAPYYYVYLNGTFIGKILNEAYTAEQVFDLSTNKNTLIDLSNYSKTELNNITLMPYGDPAYYYYIGVDDEGTIGVFDTDTEKAQEMLKTTTKVKLLTRFNATTSVNIQLTTTDRTNVVDIVAQFKGQVGSKYEITIKYYDYYNNDEIVNQNSFNITIAEDGLDADGYYNLSIFDRLTAIGPIEFWIEVREIITDKTKDYYLNSFAKTSVHQEFTTILNGFSDETVTAITAINAEEYGLENGDLTWKLPTHPYSIKVDYTVTMGYQNPTNAELGIPDKSFTATLTLNVTKDSSGNLVYTYELEDYFNNYYFTLDTANNRIVFNMKAYFADESRDNYYLAGVYFYILSAQTYDQNKIATARIQAPSSYGTADDMKKYIFQNVTYTNNPYNVLVDAEGNLYWNYDTERDLELSITTSAEFGIIIIVDGVEVFRSNTDDAIVSNTINIANFIVAGGALRNEVYVFRFAPNDFYINGVPIKADLSQVPTSTNLPSFNLTWGANSNNKIELNNQISENIYNDVYNNGDKIIAKAELIKLTAGASTVANDTNTYTFDTVQELDYVEFDYVHLGNFEYEKGTPFYTSLTSNNYFEFSVYELLFALDENHPWINTVDAVVLPGLYYLKVTLDTKEENTYYNATSAQVQKVVAGLWRTYENTLTGPYLTTQDVDNNINTTDEFNKFAWSNAQTKNVNLNLRVNTLPDLNDELHLPESITITVTNRDNDELTETKIFTLPTYKDLQNKETFTNGEVTISRYYPTEGGNADNKFINVSINLHEFFDQNLIAGAYTIGWNISSDEYGTNPLNNELTLYEEYLCHYTTLPTPVLDYRLSYNQDGTYTINWSLAPSNLTYELVEQIGNYNVSIFAFKQNNGTYTDNYEELSENEKLTFLQDVTNFDTSTGNVCLLNYATSGMRGTYAYDSSLTNNLTLQENNTYKLFVYLSANSQLNEFYLNSYTSAPVEYNYKKISGYFQEVNANYDKEQYNQGFTLNATMANTYNNAFEIYIYNTQDPEAGTNSNWTQNQKENKTYISHNIIGTQNNAQTGDLYVFTEINGLNITYGAKVGTLTNGVIQLNNDALSFLIPAEWQDIPVTYYAEIKNWINNYEVNRDATQAEQNIYSQAWLEEKLGITDTTELGKYMANITSEDIIKLSPLDLNSLNPSVFFYYQHKIRIDAPQITKIEVTGNGVTGTISTELNEGYIQATSSDYEVKIYLNLPSISNEDLYNSMAIQLTIFAYSRDSEGSLTTDFIEIGSGQFAIFDHSTTPSIVLDSNSDIFANIDNAMPNTFKFNVAPISTTSSTAGGANTTNKFINQDNANIDITYGFSFDTNAEESTQNLLIKKQYDTPVASVYYDTMSSLSTSGTKTADGNTTNVLSSGEYEGLAVNPYLYVSRLTSYSETSDQYKILSNSPEYYQVTLTYNGNSNTVNLDSSVVNTIISQNFSSITRFNFTDYIDVFNYQKACLYPAMKSLVGSNGGGNIALSIKIVPNTTSNYWASSESIDLGTIQFYTRLNPVKTNAIGDCTFGTELAKVYKNDQYYYYHHTNVPFNYYTLAGTYNYHLSLKSSGATYTQNYEAVNTSSQTLKNINLADILISKDIAGGSDNPWRSDRNYNVNIYAYPQTTSGFITRSYNSANRIYEPGLKIVNDIKSITASNVYNIDDENNVSNLNTNNVTVSTSVVSGKPNLAATYANFTVTYTDEDLNTHSNVKWEDVYISSYSQEIAKYQSLMQLLANKLSSASALGGRINYTLYFSGNSSNIVDSTTYSGTFYYYRNISISSSLYTTQPYDSDNGYKHSYITVSVSNTPKVISSVSFKLMQKILNENDTLNATSTRTDSSISNNEFSTNFSFSSSRCDALSSTEYSYSDANKLTNNYYVSSSNSGYIQAGNNMFHATFNVNSSYSTYNKISDNYIKTDYCYFDVPKSVTQNYLSASEPSYTTYGGDPEGTTYDYNIQDSEHTCPDCTFKSFKTTGDCPKCDGGTIKYGSHSISSGKYGTSYYATCDICGKTAYSSSIIGAGLALGVCEKTCTECNGEGELLNTTIQIGVQEKNCTTCSGNGKLSCTNCGGDGYLKHNMKWWGVRVYEYCTECGERNPINGNMHSEDCDKNPCDECAGTGNMDCSNCNQGKQYSVCTTCGGSHYLDERNQNITDKWYYYNSTARINDYSPSGTISGSFTFYKNRSATSSSTSSAGSYSISKGDLSVNIGNYNDIEAMKFIIEVRYSATWSPKNNFSNYFEQSSVSISGTWSVADKFERAHADETTIANFEGTMSFDFKASGVYDNVVLTPAIRPVG